MILPRFIGAHIWVLSLYIMLCESTQGQGDSMRCSREGQTELPHCIFLSRMTSSASTAVVFSLSRERRDSVFEADFQYNATSFLQFYVCLSTRCNVLCTTTFTRPQDYRYIAQNTLRSESGYINQNENSSHQWTCSIPLRPDNSPPIEIKCARSNTKGEICFKPGTCLLLGHDGELDPVQIQWLFQLGNGNNDYQCNRKILRIQYNDSLTCAQSCDCSEIGDKSPVSQDNQYCKIPDILLEENNTTNTNRSCKGHTNPALGNEKACNVTKTKNSGSDSTGAIVGAFLVILLIIIVIVIAVIIVRRRKINVREYVSKFTLCQMCPFIKKTSQPSQDAGRLGPYHVGDLQRDENNQTYNSAKSQRKTYEEVDVNYNSDIRANAHTNPDRNMPDDYERISHYKKTKRSTEDDKTISTAPTNTTTIIAGPDSSTGHSDSPDYFTHKYSHLHEEETRIPKNPYNVLLKPKVDPKHRQPIETPSDANLPNQESFKYSVALSIQDVENIRSQPIDVVDTAGTSKATPSKFRIKEKSGGTEMDENSDNDPQKEEHKYFELEREDGTAESEADAKNKRRTYFELEKVEEERDSEPSDSYY